ncbi:MAG: hypothetical protein RBR08_03555 [Desulforegulaceae bacterium]|nr:hypothetical protein [Desulforegulaceae bacterium]
MNKNEKAAIAAVIAYIELENEADFLIKMKKDAYKNFFQISGDAWHKRGVTNIMTGRKILDAKKQV